MKPSIFLYWHTADINKLIYTQILCGEMVDFGESDEMIEISGKVDKPNTYNGFSHDISFFILGRTSSD